MRLDYSFYQTDAVSAAKKLLGKILVREVGGQKIMVKIVDTEAYQGPEDKASHAYNNRRTKRTETMFARGGIAYIYLIYGMYYCFNIVTAAEDNPHAVLIRAVEPVKGLEIIKRNRKISSKNIEDLTNGPGKLSQALKIDKSLNGHDLVKSSQLYLLDNQEHNFQIQSAPRINIDYAEEYKNKKWRFYIKDNKFLSKK